MEEKGFSRDDFYDARELGAILRVDPQNIRSQEASPEGLNIPHIKIGKKLLFPKKAFENFCNGITDSGTAE